MGNCCDEEARAVSYEEGAALAKEYDTQFFECSGKRDINVEGMFVHAASKALEFASIDMCKELVRKGDLNELRALTVKSSANLRIMKYHDKVNMSLTPPPAYPLQPYSLFSCRMIIHC